MKKSFESQIIEIAKMTGLMNDPTFRSLLLDHAACVLVDHADEMKKLISRENTLKGSTGFEICKIYRSKNAFGELYDSFLIEDWNNALKIMEQYRTIGHKLNLHSITLLLNGDVVKKITFTYKK